MKEVVRGRKAAPITGEQPVTTESGQKPPGLSIFKVFMLDQAIDQDGRPLRESAAQSDVIKAQRRVVSFETRPYERKDSPSRHPGKPHRSPYEHAAYEQILAGDNFPLMLGGILYLRRHLDPSNNGRRLSLQEAFTVVNMATSLPAYMCSKAESPMNKRDIPAPMSVLVKSMLGMSKNLSNIFLLKKMSPVLIRNNDEFVAFRGDLNLEAVLGAQPREEVSPDEFVQHAETKGMLVTERRVCAAPNNMILRVSQVLIDGQIPSSVTEGHITYWDQYVGSLVTHEQFGYVAHQYEFAEQAFMQAGSILRNSKDKMMQEQQKHKKGPIAAHIHEVDAITTAFVTQLNNLQPRVNELLGRSTNAPMITAHDVRGRYGVSR